MKKMIALFVFVFSSIAVADQCVYLTKEQGQQAMRELSKAYNIQALVAPFKSQDTTTIEINRIKLTQVSDYDYALHNGLSLMDAAYTYVDGKNLAEKIDCATLYVNEELK